MIQSIIDTFVSFWAALVGLVEKVFTSLLTMLKDVLLWVLDQLLSLVTTLLGAVDLSAISQDYGIFQQIPDSTLNMMGLCGFAQCMGIVGGAIIIRILLQLIPFVRLGS
jgi:hypothetical protein